MPGFNKSYQTRFRKRCQKTQKAQKSVTKVKQTGSGSKKRVRGKKFIRQSAKHRLRKRA